jgi:hypothetical protein
MICSKALTAQERNYFKFYATAEKQWKITITTESLISNLKSKYSIKEAQFKLKLLKKYLKQSELSIGC